MDIDPDDYGRSVEFHVQKKMPKEHRAKQQQSKPLFAAGPGHAKHMSGETEFTSSGKIALPRPLTRSGPSAYTEEVDSDDGAEMEYKADYDLEELQKRQEVTHDVEHALLIVRVRLEQRPTKPTGTKRTFQGTPEVVG